MNKIDTTLPVSDVTRSFLAAPLAHFINGREHSPVKGLTLPVYDPNTGMVIANVAAGTSADIDLAVKAARQALTGPWSLFKPAERAKALMKLADLIEGDRSTLSELETANNGQSLNLTEAAEVGGSANYLRYMSGWATKISGQTLDVSIAMPPGARYRAMTFKEPVGVVGAIIPWNFPLLMAVWKIAPALAAGCTIVLKPAEETPLTALRLAALCRDAGLPDGVVNVVTGYGYEAGAALSAHPGIDKITFTGSTETGKLIGKAALDNITRFSLELGGKSPMVMFEDMDPALIKFAANIGTFFNQGQVCTCGSRVLVQRGIFDRVVADFIEVADTLKIGSGFDRKNQINPLISTKQQSRVLGLIERGRSDGAQIVAGGEAVEGSGYFVKPTVIVNVNTDMTVVREEIFGPVVVIAPFDDLADAISKANDTVYGLSASVWTRDLGQCFRFSEKVKAGTVWVNAHNLLDPNMPFGGYKQSGIGREHGQAGIDAYLETKTVCIST